MQFYEAMASWLGSPLPDADPGFVQGGGGPNQILPTSRSEVREGGKNLGLKFGGQGDSNLGYILQPITVPDTEVLGKLIG